MKKLFLIVLLLVICSFLSFFFVLRFGNKCTCYGFELEAKCIGIKTMCYGLATPIHLKEYDSENSPREINFNATLLEVGDTFNFSPNEHCVGDIKARIVGIYSDGISLDVLEEQGLNGNYYEVKEYTNIKIRDGDCIHAKPLCMDVSYDYCFSIDTSIKPNVYSYEIKGKSTMPLP